MAAFCSAVNFLRVLVIGILQETGYVSLIRRNSTFKRGKTKPPRIEIFFLIIRDCISEAAGWAG
jgi:hypothetical protein